LKKNAVAIINSYEQPPLTVSLGQEKYITDDEIVAALKRRTDKIYIIDGNKKAQELGNVRTVNIFMLGCFAAFAPLEIDVWKNTISRRLPEHIREINLKAFDMGRKEIEGVRIGKS